MPEPAIKSMKLYSAVDRIHADLAVAGYTRDAPLTVDALTPYDQLHYFGTEAVDRAIAFCGLAEGRRALDVGAGFGGPARYIADRAGAAVTAVELQPDMNRAAEELTRRAGLSDRVRHVEGDILATPLDPGAFDAVVSWLALYHIPDRAPLFPRLHAALRPGGALYVEDLYRRGALNEAEEEAMRVMLFSNTLPDEGAYRREVETAGFRNVSFEDETAAWAAFTADRLTAFKAGRSAYEAVHGPATWKALHTFYDCIAELLAAGRVGGVRLTADRA